MKLFYLSGAILPSSKANAVHIMKMCAAFARNGHDVTLVAGGLERGADPFAYYGVPESFRIAAPIFSGSAPHPLAAAAANIPFVARARADLWYVRSRSLGPWAGRGATPLVFEAHEMPRRARDRARERLIFGSKAPRRLVTISQVLMDDYVTQFSAEAGPSSRLVAHDGADPAPDVRGGRTAASTPPVIGYVGSLYPGKGVETILQIAGRRPQYHFEVVGGSQDQIHYWKQKLAPANVHFRGHIPHRELSAWYAKFDVALLPLLPSVSVDFRGSDIGRWTSPLKLFEYMAHGLPIVASDRPTIREVLTDRLTGFLAPAGDAAAWTARLDELLADYAIALEVGASARMLLNERFTWAERARAVVSGLH